MSGNSSFYHHAALVGYALSRALFERLDGGAMQGDIARAAMKYLPERPDAAESPTDLQIWREAEAELKKLGGIGP
jgi:hypothetical protein